LGVTSGTTHHRPDEDSPCPASTPTTKATRCGPARRCCAPSRKPRSGSARPAGWPRRRWTIGTTLTHRHEW